MSVTGKSGVGIPIILLHDGEGAIVTIELKTGDMYRGYLEDSEDNMNCTMKVKCCSS
jgi:small nuclear ribonucleoprotein D3